jgi:hypothetical protein
MSFDGTEWRHGDAPFRATSINVRRGTHVRDDDVARAHRTRLTQFVDAST